MRPQLAGGAAFGLVLYGIIMAWKVSGATTGYDVFSGRHEMIMDSLLGLLLHGTGLVCLGWHLAVKWSGRSAKLEDSEDTEAPGWLHIAFGLCGCVVVVLYAEQLYRAPDSASLYVHLSEELGRPPVWVSYLISLTTLAFYLGVEIRRELLRWTSADGWGLFLRVMGFVLPGVFWLLSVHALTHFVIGESLIGTARGVDSGSALLDAPVGLAILALSGQTITLRSHD